MNTLKIWVCAMAVTDFTAMPAFAQDNSPACNDELIKGNFGFMVQGAKLPDLSRGRWSASSRSCGGYPALRLPG